MAAADESYPTDLRYHPEHDWVRADGDEHVFGITWYAQDALGEVVYYDPPQVGATITKDAPYGELESVKAVSDIFAPASGEVVAVNPAVNARPEVVNEDPYGEGWLVRVKLSDPSELDSLMDEPAYRAYLAGLWSRYTSLTDEDLRTMLAAIGAASIDELFDAIPAGIRLDRPLDLPAGLPEQEVYARLRDMAARNVSAEDELTFLGAGMYDHYVPALIDSILQRSEFLTPYTPYQPEISQGGLQVMFEYQTAISELTGLPVSNASLYEGPSAVGAAAYLAKLANGRRDVVVSRGVHPHSRATLETLAPGYGQTVVEAPLTDGVTDLAALTARIGPDTTAVIVQQPNFLGAIEDLEPIVAAAKAVGALVVCACDPLPLAILKTPGELGIDVAVGEGQSLGNRLDFGGPSFGFFAASQEHIRRMPGRIAGETRDVDGRRGFVLTLQTREQHIRREKATSNICTAQVLNALAGVIYLSWLGKRGAVELAELMLRRADHARRTLTALPGVRALHDQPVAREFALALEAPVAAVLERCAAEGVNAGYALGHEYPEYADGLLVAITEQRSRADIDRLADVLGRAVAAERSTSMAGAGA